MSTPIDYKNTLNLPQTDFPMKASLPTREPVMLNMWKSTHLYQAIRKARQGAPTFILHDGPPYANARPHLGTALNKILKDIVVKSKTLSGYDAPFVPGWDCHGLPIELNVEKTHGKVGVKLDAKAFRAACRAYAETQVDLQRADFERMGVLGDWEHPYLTLHFHYEAETVRALATMVERGHLVRGQKPVHWCIACGSSLAEAEVEYRQKTSHAIDVAFSVEDLAAAKQRADRTASEARQVVIPIWTTTPWTLPANEAVCLHPTVPYAWVEATFRGVLTAFVIARELVDAVMARYSITDFTVHVGAEGRVWEGLRLQHPFLSRTVPVVLGEHVTTDTGTGAVHTAPAHGEDDYEVGVRYQLPLDNPVGSDGRFVAATPFFAGLTVEEGNAQILVRLADEGRLLHHAKIEHSYPHCWRHRIPLIFRATPQWFIGLDVAGLRDIALKAIDQVTWKPAWGHTRIRNMVASRPDWCISRQRTWGIPLCLAIHRETGVLHPEIVSMMRRVSEDIAREGLDAWYDYPLSRWLGDEAQSYEKVLDILDVWFDSGVTHHVVLGGRPELRLPADLYLEGSDQHRGWFQSSLLASEAIRGEAPYRAVLTHGYVVDGEGRKMSKSVGNVMVPPEVVDTLGADVLRLWVAAADHTNDINVSKEILTRTADAYRRIRNTARFLLANLSDFDASRDQLPASEWVDLDCFAVESAMRLQQAICEAYAAYEFQTVYQLIHNFCTVFLGSFYLDVIKDRQYTAKRDSRARRSSQNALYHVAQAFVRWIAPILSFTAEEMWSFMPVKAEASVFLAEWYTAFPIEKPCEVRLARWTQLMDVRTEVNKALEAARQAGEIGSGLAAYVTVHAPRELYDTLQALKEELRFVWIVSVADLQVADTLKVVVTPLSAEKCARCWQRRDDVGFHVQHPTICARCVENVDGSGEVRAWA